VVEIAGFRGPPKLRSREIGIRDEAVRVAATSRTVNGTHGSACDAFHGVNNLAYGVSPTLAEIEAGGRAPGGKQSQCADVCVSQV
jgi:hypothetical protein